MSLLCMFMHSMNCWREQVRHISEHKGADKKSRVPVKPQGFVYTHPWNKACCMWAPLDKKGNTYIKRRGHAVIKMLQHYFDVNMSYTVLLILFDLYFQAYIKNKYTGAK